MVKKVPKDSEANAHLTELVNKVSEMEQNYLRVLADFKNQERRHKEQATRIVSMANASLIEKLLLVLDSLLLAEKHLQDPGLQLVLDQFLKTLESEGLQKMSTTGKTFDPNTMDCIELVPGKHDHVLETISEGYSLNDTVLRPAKVKVGNGDPVIASHEVPKQSHTN